MFHFSFKKVITNSSVYLTTRRHLLAADHMFVVIRLALLRPKIKFVQQVSSTNLPRSKHHKLLRHHRHITGASKEVSEEFFIRVTKNTELGLSDKKYIFHSNHARE
jgi:hypothetical protein